MARLAFQYSLSIQNNCKKNWFNGRVLTSCIEKFKENIDYHIDQYAEMLYFRICEKKNKIPELSTDMSTHVPYKKKDIQGHLNVTKCIINQNTVCIMVLCNGSRVIKGNVITRYLA